MAHDILTSTFLRLRSRLKASARLLLADDTAADDALQEAFYKLWSGHDKIVNHAQAEGLTVIAVRNTCIDSLRRSRRRAESPLENKAAELADDEADNERRELYEAVTHIINNKLSERERLVITMRDSQGMDFADIALELGISEANARMILSRARKSVREIYLSSK